jgi:hypothetical protein
MPKRPKIALGLALLTIVLVFLFTNTFSSKIGNTSTFQVSSNQNKFNISFSLTKNDKPHFENVLSALKLPGSLEKGATFELDSTSSAKLSYVSPVDGWFTFGKNTINFSGKIQRAAVPANFVFQSFNFPQNLNFAISGTNLTQMAQNYLNFPKNLADSISKNSSPDAQIIASFGQEPNIVYVFKTGNFDITSLKDLAAGGEYKQEFQGAITLYILKSVTAFEIGDYTFIASNLDCAKAMISAIKSKSYISFPAEKEGVLSLLYINTDKNPVPQSVLIKMFNSGKKVPTFLKDISKLNFTLKDKSFSGSIITK